MSMGIAAGGRTALGLRDLYENAPYGGEVVRDSRGTSVHTRATVIDITARKRAEDEARIHAEQLEAISQRVVEIHDGTVERLDSAPPLARPQPGLSAWRSCYRLRFAAITHAQS